MPDLTANLSCHFGDVHAEQTDRSFGAFILVNPSPPASAQGYRPIATMWLKIWYRSRGATHH